MNYPDRLLPQPHFKKIVWSKDWKDYFLIHFTDTKDNIDPTTGKLKEMILVKESSQLKDYSNNLLGVFITDDIYWAIQKGPSKEYLMAEWNIGDAVTPPTVPTDYDRDESRGYFFLKIKDCHEIIVPDYYGDIKTTVTCRLLHTPTNSNYWHFSLRWFCNGQDVSERPKGQRRRVSTAAKAFITERAFFEKPTFEPLEKRVYSD